MDKPELQVQATTTATKYYLELLSIEDEGVAVENMAVTVEYVNNRKQYHVEQSNRCGHMEYAKLTPEQIRQLITLLSKISEL
jgi:hypothetical protein